MTDPVFKQGRKGILQWSTYICQTCSVECCIPYLLQI